MDGRDSDEEFQHQAAAHSPVSGCPLLDGARVTLLPSGAATFDAMFELIGAARHSLLMEFYEVEDVHWRGVGLFDLLVEKLGQGVRLALSYDAAGSQDTDDALFDRLRRAGATVFEFHPFSPFRKRFNPLTLNDRDHRKILIADGARAIVGGVNLSRVYENPRSAGTPRDTKKAFWYDAAAILDGPPVGELVRLFVDNWYEQSGERLAPPPTLPLGAPGSETVRVDGSAPRQRRQLYFQSLKAAVAAARSRILLSTGYFVPSHRQWRLFAEAAERGVEVDLLLAGYSDVPSCTRAARALYGRLLERGVRIHEVRDGMLHAKVSTIDGVWSAIGSSNLDRRSLLFNNEIDAIVLGRTTAAAVEAMLLDWKSRADTITLAEWRARSLGERAGELLTRVWSRYM